MTTKDKNTHFLNEVYHYHAGSTPALNNEQYAMSGFTPIIDVASSTPSIMTRNSIRF
jgi:hypothetical protein